ncbi:DUF3618 domain-containing protein [Roseococcus sp. DSY-14]|uniref:DUF3618 domain-containing protein n=1 Tax=Roseococcus sp. DSY-14 TaxID=3369650 RepID=UPI00387B7499
MSGITDPGDKSPAEIEREVEQTRSNVSSTLDELRAKLKPSQMVDEVVGEAVEWVKGSGGTEFARNLGVAIRDNPLPVALIGAGLAWLLFSGGRSDAAPPRREQRWREVRYPDGSYSRTRVEAPAQPASSAGFASRTLHDARDAVTGAASSVASTASDLASRAGEAAQGVLEGGKAQVAALADQAGIAAGRAGDQFRAAEPFLYGALGLAIGAGIGALLPRTEVEDRLLGEQREAAFAAARESMDTVRAVAEDKLAEARDTIVETYEGTMERLDREGLAEAPRILSDAASQVGGAVQDTVRSAAEEAKRGLQG